MTTEQRRRDRRTQIGSDILRGLNHDERTALDLWLAEAIGDIVEGTISGMRANDLREFLGQSAIEDLARGIGMEFPHEDANAGCDPVTM
jgi:hypothetical protein